MVSIKLPAACFGTAGVLLVTCALISSSPAISAVLGIMGIIAMWDAYEFIRQQHRIIKGYAPANPDNPRHAKILAEHVSATLIHWLKREPIGRPLSADEIRTIREVGR